MNQMKRVLSSAGRLWVLLLLCCLVVLAAAGCGSSREDAGPAAGEATPALSDADVAQDQNACHLLTHEDVSALVEEEIVMRDQTDAGETWSTCQWENENAMPLFTLTVYWTDGKQQWETWRIAQGLGSELVGQAEGVGADGVVQQGPVAGIGDGAYFSELLSSLVLKGDILFEMNLFFVPGAEGKFASLAEQLLASVK